MSLLTSDDDSLSEGSPLLDESDSVVLLSPSSANQIRSPTESTKELYKQLGLGMPSSEIGRKCGIKHSRTPSSDPTEVAIISSTGGSFLNQKTTLDNNSNIVYQSSQSLYSGVSSYELYDNCGMHFSVILDRRKPAPKSSQCSQSAIFGCYALSYQCNFIGVLHSKPLKNSRVFVI